MWKLFFETCDFLARLIPMRHLREHVRRNRLHDYRRKYNALRAAFPHLDFRHVIMIKGGWNIGFIVDHKYVFKIRKNFDKDTRMARIIREKRITDAFADISPLKIPHIEIVEAAPYTFYKYDFIPGRNMNTFSRRTIERNAWKWGKQIATFIDAVHHGNPAGIDDLKTGDGDGWNHNDICNNVIINPKTMDVVGMVDWEYAGWGTIETEIRNTTRFSKKIRDAGLGVAIELNYIALQKNKK